MATQAPTGQDQDHSVEKKIQQFRELFADAPEIGRRALENALHELRSQASDLPPPAESAGRVGARLGKVSLRGGEYFFMPSISGLNWIVNPDG